MFNYGSGRNSTERFFAFSLFSGHSQPILAWNEAMMVFSKFLNFFAIFLEFCIPGRVGTHQNDFFFFFSLFHGLSEPIFSWNEAMRVFCNFLNFFAIFLEFSIPGRLETHRNDYFIFSLFQSFPTDIGLKRSYDGVF